MTPPIFDVVSQSARVRELLGSPVRLYPAGQNTDAPVVYPYAVWQLIGGAPVSYLAGRPDADSYTLQVDVYCDDKPNTNGLARVRDAAAALRDAIELSCYVTSWRGESRDAETKSFRISFDVDWIVPRN